MSDRVKYQPEPLIIEGHRIDFSLTTGTVDHVQKYVDQKTHYAGFYPYTYQSILTTSSATYIEFRLWSGRHRNIKIRCSGHMPFGDGDTVTYVEVRYKYGTIEGVAVLCPQNQTIESYWDCEILCKHLGLVSFMPTEGIERLDKFLFIIYFLIIPTVLESSLLFIHFSFVDSHFFQQPDSLFLLLGVVGALEVFVFILIVLLIKRKIKYVERHNKTQRDKVSAIRGQIREKVSEISRAVRKSS